MSERKSDAQALELTAFTRQADSLEGTWPLACMPRLAQGLWQLAESSAATWQAQGEQIPVTGGEAEIWLHLQGQAAVELQCQRCLQSVSEALSVARSFRFVRDEAAAAKLDEESEDDVLVLPPRLDLMELLEDEFILGLPIVPMHDECPKPLVAPGAPSEVEEPAPNPFAALAALRTRKEP